MVKRLDLDGTYSPMGLVTKILEHEPDLKIPVPIQQLAHDLDISEIQPLKTEGFEGGLLTDEARSFGAILVNETNNKYRQRFTVAHELAHFLIAYHKPRNPEEGFLCDRKSMNSWDTKSQNAYFKMEAEANLFASLLLMPPPHLRSLLNKQKFNSLSTVLEIHKQFLVSKEAAARAFAEHTENIAIIISKDNKYLHSYRNRNFPWIDLKRDNPIPQVSGVYTDLVIGRPNTYDETQAEYWISTDIGSRIPRMNEQVMLQSSGFAMIMLEIINYEDDAYDQNENMTSKERYRLEQERKNQSKF